MFKSVSSLLVLLLAVSTFSTPLEDRADVEPLSICGNCGTIVGTQPCTPGLQCCYLYPDYGV
ncbi:hypothetical protein L218DRAFT_1000765 [Marasmius fiardii PR-910]|nr:hypothetical protein L218DRAFT_1000765 [Marasmius fiardii PR-910]